MSPIPPDVPSSSSGVRVPQGFDYQTWLSEQTATDIAAWVRDADQHQESGEWPSGIRPSWVAEVTADLPLETEEFARDRTAKQRVWAEERRRAAGTSGS